ncbi:MAG TPA: sigma-54 dependent transcriptional regulator [Candidatus Binatus sp.]|nr:sigma-54 dependent transcriptional regulator [Candidatus Binatus sp.]
MEGPEQSGTLLVVDDDRDMLNIFRDVLGASGYRVLTAGSGSEALAVAEQSHPDLLISDLRMNGMNGHQLQRELKKLAPDLPVIVITAFGSIQTAVESMRLGAFDYVTKPYRNDELLLVVERALRERELRQEVRRLREQVAQQGLEPIIGRSPRILEVLELLKQVADSLVSVLITGESGVGKDLFARALHHHSSWRTGPYVAINCAAIPANLIESELFGHVRGAFTDAHRDKAGLFQAAHKGTLFLDEIGELSFALQAKLLRVLESKRVRPIGATHEVAVDVRIVSATNANLDQLVAQSKFRADLYYRLTTMTIAIPPLRDRPEDIPLLISHFLARAAAQVGKPVPKVSDEAVSVMLKHSWPGNIREMQNALQRAAAMCTNGVIRPVDLPPEISGRSRQTINIDTSPSRTLTLDEMELEYMRAVLASVGGNRGEAARVLGVDRKTLYRRLEGEKNARSTDDDAVMGTASVSQDGGDGGALERRAKSIS